MAVAISVLGPIEVRVDGRRIDVGHARQQSVLVAVLLSAGTPVAVDQLVEQVWARCPPQQARGIIYTYVSRLRSALAGADGVDIYRERDGYALHLRDVTVDLHRFRDLSERARLVDDGPATTLLETALTLWRREPFAGIDAPRINDEREILNAERLAVELDLADLRLRRGDHTVLLPALRARADTHPLDERVAGQLLLALYRCGRQAEALDRYETLRRTLADGFGSDPGPELRRLHEGLLLGAPEVAAPPPGSIRRGSEVGGTSGPPDDVVGVVAVPAPVAEQVR